jgi:MGT family glycosyltransferase
MATIVFLSVPAYGHLLPVLGIIRELVRRGHDVRVLNGSEMAPVVARTGARFVAYPPALAAADFVTTLKHGNLVAFIDMMLKATPPLADFTLEHLRAEPADVIVYDAIAYWGVIAKRTLALPAVSDSPIFVPELIRHMVSWRELMWYGREIVGHLPSLAMGWIRLALRYGVRRLPLFLPLLPMRGDVNIVLSSREVHPKSPRFKNQKKWVFVGGTMDPETRPDPFDFSRLDGRPLVLVSLGTIQFTNDAFFRMVMDEFADFPAQFVLAAGPGSDPDRLGAPPDNFIVVPTYPQLPLLERASAFITHGGLGSVHEGLWHGVPMVAVPQHFEQLRNARAAQDAAIVLDARCYGRAVPAAALRAALEEVVANPRYRAASARLGKSLRAGGGSKAAADTIEQVAAGHSRRVQGAGRMHPPQPPQQALPDA